LLTEGSQEDGAHIGKKRRGAKGGRESLMSSKVLGPEELSRQRKEILQDKENLHVRRVCLCPALGH
jgi:division protein 1